MNMLATEMSYTTRKSNRAKYLRANIDHLGKVELVVPRRMSLKEAHYWMQQNMNWVNERRQHIVAQRSLPAEVDSPLPTQIPIESINQTFSVKYKLSDDCMRTKLTCDYAGSSINITAYDRQKAHTALEKWLAGLAKKILLTRLDMLSQAYNLPFNKGFVRKQKTRWGSCSSQHNINLNRNLVFLNQSLVDYLITHELCHTVHFDHSKRFWQLVGTYQPDYKVLDRTLNSMTNRIPAWVLADN